MSENVYTAAIPVAEMFVDRSYQRELDERRAHRMGATWDPRLVGVLDVADRGEDQSPRYAVVNGQHRWAAASHAGTTTHLAANVHTGLTVADEAALFRDIDLSTKKLSTWDRWKARRAAGDDTVLGIDRIAEGVGLKVAPGGATNALGCLSALEAAYRRDPQFLSATLASITDLWPGDPAGLKAGIVRGLFEILRSDELDEERLVDALVEVTPTQLHARAVESRKIHDGQQWQCVVRVIVDAYNQAGRGKVDPQIVLGAA
ncbi:DUF6551 family protein [Tsukamurella tyrosinosolvens]|uniref:DUF6551 family protein n=1 Tax=Tsukamurella tyrosinosolvens TaxID=57704 RepID=UPI002DD447C1|nr:DUF6551 family protein [Tsukamurella tyrosinosolvens]MEC4615826.1 DUF6551 family protein [Tsukamurella tyrosinosolvens]